MGFSPDVLFLFVTPNYGVGKAKAIAESGRLRMVVVRLARIRPSPGIRAPGLERKYAVRCEADRPVSSVRYAREDHPGVSDAAAIRHVG
jgi:hypothetical protein